jgi:hypothetical protein
MVRTPTHVEAAGGPAHVGLSHIGPGAWRRPVHGAGRRMSGRRVSGRRRCMPGRFVGPSTRTGLWDTDGGETGAY